MVKFLILFSSCLNLIPKNGMSFKYFNALITSSFDIPSSFAFYYITLEKKVDHFLSQFHSIYIVDVVLLISNKPCSISLLLRVTNVQGYLYFNWSFPFRKKLNRFGFIRYDCIPLEVLPCF